MSLHKKTIIIVASTTLVMILLQFFLSKIILLTGFVKLEDALVNNNVNRVKNAVYLKVSNLDSMTYDWASWDETYAFIKGKKNNFIEDNFTDKALVDMDIDFIALVNSSNKVLYGKEIDARDFSGKKIDEATKNFIIKEYKPFQKKDSMNYRSGIAILPQGPMLISIRPILTSYSKGPMRGVMILGQYVDEDFIKRLSEITECSVEFELAGKAVMKRDYIEAFKYLSENKSVMIRNVDNRNIAGYALLNDIEGAPALLFRVKMSRDIYKQGKYILNYFLLFVLATGLISGTAILLLLDRGVVSKVTDISETTAAIAEAGSIDRRVTVSGNDELTKLSSSINSMLDALEDSTHELQKSEDRYKRLSMIDDLTKLFNARHFFNNLNGEVERAMRYRHPLSILLMDIDDFKHHNDNYGHLEGDKVLSMLGEVIFRRIRKSDSAYRYGGEEFTILLPETTSEAAASVAETIRKEFEIIPFHPEHGHIVHVTLSIGVAEYRHGESASSFVSRADSNMYKAKRFGKNRIISEA